MLKIVQSHPEWILPLFAPGRLRLSNSLPAEESVAGITRDICLQLFRRDSRWLNAEARKGTLVPSKHGLIQTVRWQTQNNNPVRRRIRL
jgi:hypothetical protein